MNAGIQRLLGPILRAQLNFPMIAKVCGAFVIGFSVLMILPPLVQLIDGQGIVVNGHNVFVGFGLTALIGVVAGTVLYRAGRRSKTDFFRREGLLSVALVWFVTGFLGGLPLVFSGSVAGFWDGVFESVSGLTTTGSSIYGGGGNPVIEDLPAAILFWRALLHWIGGIGIVVMFLVFLPVLGVTEKKLFQAEVAGVSKEGVKPRIRESAAVLVRIYCIFSLFLALGFWVLGMDPFEAVAHSFATIATGGFSTRNGSLAEFQSLGIELFAIFGMFFAGANFGLFFRVETLFRKAAGRRLLPRWADMPRFREVTGIFTGDPEFRLYASIVGGCSLLIGLYLWLGAGTTVPSAGFDRVHDYTALGESLRDASFHTTSLSSCTGFANCDTSRWPFLPQMLLLLVMFLGACSGSTGGGIKLARVLVLWAWLRHVLRRFRQPRSVDPLKVGGQLVDQELLQAVLGLFVLWISVAVLGALLLLLLEPGLDPLSSLSSLVTCLSNAGPGFTPLVPAQDAVANGLGVDVGSYGSFGGLSAGSKALLSFAMIFGRLEIYTPLIVLLPSFWRG